MLGEATGRTRTARRFLSALEHRSGSRSALLLPPCGELAPEGLQRAASASAHAGPLLDVGTGTGIWTLEMQALFPHARIVGADVSLQSLPQPVPPTCVFVRANVLEGLPFPDGQFTFTHQRLLVAAIPAQAWPGVVRELVRVTRPGGWIELVEASDVFQPAGPATRRLLQWLADNSQRLETVTLTTRSLAPVRTRSSAFQLVDSESL
jgi:ubiquinone/menaquinone biosynthesis C-methylase UbiE